MKVYFAGSIKGGREKQQDYYDLIKFIGNYAIVLTEHVGNVDTNIKNEIKYSPKEDEHVYIRDTKWIDECDLVIADVSIPSLGVGYELGYAEAHNKKIICLYDNNSEKDLSYMLSGNKYNEIFKYEKLSDVYDYLKEILDEN